MPKTLPVPPLTATGHSTLNKPPGTPVGLKAFGGGATPDADATRPSNTRVNRTKENKTSSLNINTIITLLTSRPPPLSAALHNSSYTISPPTLLSIWSAFSLHLRSLLSRPSPPTVKVSDLGTFGHRRYNLGIKIPTFVLNTKFAKRWGLRQEKSVASGGNGFDKNGDERKRIELSGGVKVVKFKPSDLGLTTSELGMKGEELSYALSMLFDAIGGALSGTLGGTEGREVEVDFGVGILRGGGGAGSVNFCFMQRPDVPSSVKRNGGRGVSPRVKRFEVPGMSSAAEHEVTKGSGNKKNKEKPNLSLNFSKLHLNANLTTTPRNAASGRALTAEALRSWSPVFTKPIRDSGDYGFLLQGEGGDGIDHSNGSNDLGDEPPPPLLDAFARLPCSTITGGNLLTSASDKIGCYYEERVNYCFLDMKKGRIGVRSKGAMAELLDSSEDNGGFNGEDTEDVFGLMQMKEDREREGEEKKENTILANTAINAANVNNVPNVAARATLSAMGAQRYFYYLNSGSVATSLISEFPSAISQTLVSRFPTTPKNVMDKFLEEVKHLYYRALKKSTLDYVLLNPHERRRLRIEKVPDDMVTEMFGATTNQASTPLPPAVWVENYQYTIRLFNSRNIITTPLVIAHALWRDYEHLCLVDVPTSYDSHLTRGSHRQVNILQFEEEQRYHLKSVVDTLKSGWYSSLSNVFQDAIEGDEFIVDANLMERYVEAIAVLMQSQLREIVTKSIKSLEDFFAMFEVKGEGGTEGGNTNPLFWVDDDDDGGGGGDGDGDGDGNGDGDGDGDDDDDDDDDDDGVGEGDDERIDDNRKPATDSKGAGGRENARTDDDDRTAPNNQPVKLSSSSSPRSVSASPIPSKPQPGRSSSAGSPINGPPTTSQPPPLQRKSKGRKKTKPTSIKTTYEYTRPPPPFKIDLNVNFTGNYSIILSTSLSQVTDRIMDIFDMALTCFDDIEVIQDRNSGYGNGKKSFIKVINENDHIIVKARNNIKRIISENLKLAHQSLSRYESFHYLMEKSDPDMTGLYLEERDEIINKFSASMAELRSLPTSIPLVMVSLNGSNLHAQLDQMAERKIRNATESVVSECMTQNQKSSKHGRTVWSKLSKKPTNTDELIKTENYLRIVKDSEMPQLYREIAGIKDQVNFMFEHSALTGDILDSVYGTYRQVKDVDTQFHRATEIAHAKRMEFENNARDIKRALMNNLKNLEDQVDTFKLKGDMKLMVQKYLEQLDSLSTSVEQAKLKANVINQEESKLGWVTTDFKQITVIEDKVEPFRMLWSTSLTFRAEYASWTRSPLFNLDRQAVEENHKNMLAKMLKLKERFEEDGAPEPASVAASVAEKLQAFGIHIPLLRALTNTRLQKGHWKKISAIVGFTISPKDNAVSWTNLKDQGALTEENIKKITVLSTEADKDYDQVVYKDYVVEMDDDKERLCITLVKDEDHPWVLGGIWTVDQGKLEKDLICIRTHLDRIKEISESINGEEFAVEAENLKEDYQKCHNMVEALVETHVVWTSLIKVANVRDGGGNRERAHQISAADAQWRNTLSELEENEAGDESDGSSDDDDESGKGNNEEDGAGGGGDTFDAEKDTKGNKVDVTPLGSKRGITTGESREGVKKGKKLFALVKHDNLYDKIVEVRDVLKALKKGDDTRKLFRRITRRASAVIKITGGKAFK